MDFNIAILSLEYAMSFLFPILVFATIGIYYLDFPGFLEACGLTLKEVALLIGGSIVGVLAEIPIIIWGNSLLAINVGGALIPIVLSVYLLKKRLITNINTVVFWYAINATFACLFALSAISPFFQSYQISFTIFGNIFVFPYLFIALTMVIDIIALVIVSLSKSSQDFSVHFIMSLILIQVISIMTWYITYMLPGQGIASDFPYYLLPGVVSAILAVVIYRRNMSKVVPLAYIAASIGTLLGADVSRVPVLFQDFGTFTGSIGGAGPLDMVFLSGMLALSVTFLFATKALKDLPRSRSWPKVFMIKKETTLKKAEDSFSEKKYTESVKLSLEAVDEGIRSVRKRIGGQEDGSVVMARLMIHPAKINDYILLKNTASQTIIDETDAQRALTTAKYLIVEIEKGERKILATASQRLVAFLIDMFLLAVIFLPITVIIYLHYKSLLSPILEATLMWVWVSQMIYFTICEWLWGKSLGKKLVHIMVVTDEQTRCGFIHSFTRNVIRLIDVSFFFLITLVAIMVTKNRQRLGDWCARTIVIKVP